MKPETYADALIALAERGVAPKQAVKSLASYLRMRGKEGILRNLKSQLLRKGLVLTRKGSVVLEVANDRDVAHAKKETITLSTPAQAVRIDETLVGGWRLTAGSTLVDNSFKKHLLHFYKQIVT